MLVALLHMLQLKLKLALRKILQQLDSPAQTGAYVACFVMLEFQLCLVHSIPALQQANRNVVLPDSYRVTM